MTDATAEVLRERDGSIETLTLNRPETLNSWTPSMAVLFREALDAADTDPTVRVIIVTGAGKGFCAGGDLGLKVEGGKAAEREYGEPYLGAIHPRSIRKPLIAAINGGCAGVGLSLALSCDIRFAGADVRFASAFVRRGRVGTPGLPWLLSRIAGPTVALDLMLSGRKFDADEALRLGLLTGVAPAGTVVARARAYAEDLSANCAPRSMAELKRVIYRSFDETHDASVERGAELLAASKDWPEAHEGVTSYLERRAPSFPPLPEH